MVEQPALNRKVDGFKSLLPHHKHLGLVVQGDQPEEKSVKTFFAKASCGCCEVEMQFESAEAASAAFHKAGLDSTATIVDDAGTEHTGVDTFYGLSESEEEQQGRSLGYLIDQLRGS